MYKLRKMWIENSKDGIKRDIDTIKKIAFKKSNAFDIRDYKSFKDSIAKELKNIKNQEEQITNEMIREQMNNQEQTEIEFEEVRHINNIEIVMEVEEPRRKINQDVMVVYGD